MRGDTIRILVVDDELGMRKGCGKILTSEGYDVETAEDGEAGLARFLECGDFAAVLIDLKMPRMGGIELIEKIREHDEDALLLVITAYATIETAVEATKRGAYGYIPKPFTPDELLLNVKNGLEKRALSIETKRLREERDNRLLEVAYERSKSNTIINCMTDGVLVVNRDRKLVLRNAVAVRVIPACASIPLPAPLQGAVPYAELRDLLVETLDAGFGPIIASREITFGKCTYMVNASPVIEPDGEVLGAVAVFRDITALKELEVAKSMFVSMVAHEVKAPLAAIEGYLNLILEGVAGEDPEKHREMMHKALVRARTLRSMVSELISLTAIETGNFTLRRLPLDISEVVAEAVDSYRERAEEKQIELSFGCNGSLKHERVLADKEVILSVFTNLLDNAIKYTPEKGHVSVRVEHDGIYVRIRIKDDGIGMTPDEKERAFDEFFRAKNEYTVRVPGTGLGLTLVKRVVEMHQGKVSVESSPGRGSVFSVSLPVADHAAAT